MQTEYDEVKSHEHTHPVEREQNRVISVRLFAVIRHIFKELNYRRSYILIQSIVIIFKLQEYICTFLCYNIS
jgi:hypothetical protein